MRINSTRFQREKPIYNKNNDNYYNKNKNKNNNYNYNNDKKKYYKIFILTKDDYYLIIEKRKLYKSLFFKNIFDLDKTSGNINNPLFLKSIESKYLKCITEYLNYYYNKIDYFEKHSEIIYNDIDKYFNSFDKVFFNKFKNYNITELEEFNHLISYYYIDSLNKKLELCLFFLKNKDLISD